jgi:autotransporter-associated beta strand protein
VEFRARSSSQLRADRRRSSALIAVAAGSVASLLGMHDASATITHRYSFNETLDTTTQTSTAIIDSIGGLNGVLVNRNVGGAGLAPSFSGGQLTLNNTGAAADVTKGNYIDLPNFIAATPAVTIEAWSTWAANNGNWQRLFDIGSTNVPANFGEIDPADTLTGTPAGPTAPTPTPATYAGSSYLFISPQTGRNGNVYGSEVRNGPTLNAVADNIGGGGIGTGEHVQTLTLGNGALRLYRDGVLVASTPTAITADTIGQQNAWIGRSNFSADPFYNGTLNEFRIYDDVASPATTLFRATLGADTLATDPAVVTNNFTGAGDYNTAANWSAGAPGANQLAVIGNGATATVSTATSFAHQLRISSGQLTVDNAATYTVAGGVDLNGGPASINVVGGATLATPSIFVDGDLAALGGAKTITLDNGTLNLSTAPAGAVLAVGGPGVSVVLGAGNGTIHTGAANFTIDAPISGTGGLTKLGTGALNLLNGTNSYAGATDITGTLSFVQGALPAGSPTSPITSNAATLIWAGANTTDITAGRMVTLNAGTNTFNVGANNVTLTGPLSGAGGLTKVGAGTLALANGATSYGGATVVNGPLSFVQGALPAGSAASPITSNAATLIWAGANTTDITAGRTVTINAGRNTFDVGANDVTFSGEILGGGAFSKTGSGTLTINNRLANGTASTTGIENFFVRNGTVTLGSGAVVQVGGTGRTGRWTSIGEQNGDVGTLNVNANAEIAGVGDFNVADVGSARGTLNINGGTVRGNVFYVGKGTTSQAVVNQTAGSLYANTASSGEWRIGGNDTTASAAAVAVYNLGGGVLSTLTTNTIPAAGATNSGAAFQVGASGNGQLNQTAGTVVTQNWTDAGRHAGGFGVIDVSGGQFIQNATDRRMFIGEVGYGVVNVRGTGQFLARSATTIGNGGATAGGVLNLLPGGTYSTTNFNTAGTNTLGSVINFDGGTLKNLAANGDFIATTITANVQAGGANIDTTAGDVTISAPLVAPAADGVTAVTATGSGFTTTPVVRITGGGGIGASALATVDAGGNLTGITVTSPGSGYSSDPTISILGANGGTATVGTITRGTPASGGLTKLGANTLFLNGASTYTGPTNVSAGTLGGTGSLVSAVTVASAGTVAPGMTVGTLSVGGFAIGGAGGTLAINLDPAAAVTSDSLNVTGLVSLTGGNLALSVAGTPTTGQTFQIITNDLVDSVVGTFATANGSPIVGDMFTLGDFNYAINYGGGDGNDVQLTATVVPEPAALGLFGLAMAGLIGGRRRRTGTHR